MSNDGADQTYERLRPAFTVAAAVIGGLLASWLIGDPGAVAATMIALVVGLSVVVLPLAFARSHGSTDRSATREFDEVRHVPPTEPATRGDKEPTTETSEWWTTGEPPSMKASVESRTLPEPQPAATPHPPVDLSRFRRVRRQSRMPQCPTCGGLRISATDGRSGVMDMTCTECGNEFAWRLGDPWPLVVVDVRRRRAGSSTERSAHGR